ncbi:MAG: hypothetical protein O3C60_20560 [Planctomycetota bacterium]|nr:hypothetical protein [Planctomycetota bacterium]
MNRVVPLRVAIRRVHFLLPICKIVVGVLMLGFASDLESAELYNGSIGTVPSAQGWSYFTNPPFGPTTTQVMSGTGVVLDTSTNVSEQAGYFSRNPIFPVLQHPAMPILGREVGFFLDVRLQVLQEQHATRDDNGDGIDDRAGFSVLLLAEDRWGIEIGFWENQLWVYEDDARGPAHRFTQAESTLFDTTQLTDYRFQILGNQYWVHGDQRPILQGNVRNYQFFTGSPDVYELPSFLFLGDNTSSARSQVLVERIAVSNGVATPACDVNADVSVDGADLAIVFSNWGSGALGDVNLDQVTDGADVGICYANWTGDSWTDKHSVDAFVPAPAGHVLALATTLMLVTNRRTRRAS